MKKYVVALVAILALTGCSQAPAVEADQPVRQSVSATPEVSEPTKTPEPQVEKKDPSEGLEEAVHAYSAAFLSGDGMEAYNLFSKDCKAVVDHNYFIGITLAAKETYGPQKIQDYEEVVEGNKAFVTYTYPDPVLNQTDEPWVKEKGAWKNNDCQ